MKIISVAGDRVAILLDGKDSNGQYTVMEATLPPKSGPPPHVHTREDEAFLVLTGEVTFYLGDKTILLKKGESLFAPRNIPHHFKNTGTEDAVLLETASPAGIEDFFVEAGKPLASRQDRPQPPTADDIKLMRTIASKYGLTILSPK
ncbi:MAG: cupin domain-containing protein [Deltaproteobacteria bacterium]|nr:cupin domain-containing protein [Deltaproteobacteria bacterium]